MTTDSNVIDFTLFRRPNSLAKLPVPVKRPVPPDTRWLQGFAGGLILGVISAKIVRFFRRR